MSNLLPYRYRGLSRPFTTQFEDDFFRPFFFGGDAAQGAFRVDVRDDGESFVIEAEIPGVKRENVHIDVEDGVLTISAEWGVGKDKNEGGYIVNERRSGRAQRSFTLDNVIEDAITAEFNDGILSVKLPKREDTRRAPRRIELN